MHIMQVITSCNSTQQELCQEFCAKPEASQAAAGEISAEHQADSVTQDCRFEYVDHVKTYPKFKFAGIEGTKVCTVAFRKCE